MLQASVMSSPYFARSKDIRQTRCLPRENDLGAGIGDDAPMAKENSKEPTPEFDLHIGPWINALGRRQSEIATKLGINEGYLSQLISGQKNNPSYDLIKRLADELGIPIDYLRRMPPTKTEIDEVLALDPGVLNRIRQPKPQSRE
jgi:predicted XRE-type DNA-binding protein